MKEIESISNQDRNQLPSSANTQMSFWKRNLNTTVTTALAIGIGVSAALYSINK